MKSPAHNAKSLRKLGAILAEIHPASPRIFGDAATQLEILDVITHIWMQEDGNLDKLDRAVRILNAKRVLEAQKAGTTDGIDLVHTDGKVPGLDGDQFNVSRN